MSKVHFDENELMIMAMFEQDTAENTKKELEEVLPYVADDMAVRLLVEQMISKMENLPDEQFKNLELDLYRPDARKRRSVMSANLFMIYQINDLEKSRDYRCRPYEYQIENGFMVTSENYVLGYKASLIQGVTPGRFGNAWKS